MSDFVPNKLATKFVDYHCSNDCKVSGCPGHRAIFDYQSTSDIFAIHFGDSQSLYLDMNKMEQLVEWVNQLQS